MKDFYNLYGSCAAQMLLVESEGGLNLCKQQVKDLFLFNRLPLHRQTTFGAPFADAGMRR